MKVSLSIVTYNNSNDINSLLESLKSSECHHLFSDIYVIDNNSNDSTCDVVRGFQGFVKNIHLIQNVTNTGFGLAHNQAILTAKSDYHVICNPDIKFKDRSLENLIKHLETNHQIGLAAPKVVYPNGNIQLLNRRYPTVVDLDRKSTRLNSSHT